ncbi:hypothetical protein EU527_02990 [Candidatus Thorarchaeota archaeon]|nr:MAG: hypothetical protein EU527_02990 [Candidatus Thorarchaeota archaeon]
MDADRNLLVESLEKIAPEDIEVHGGKATNLAKLSLKGFQIPQGFSISCINFSNMISDLPEISIALKQVEKTDDFEEMISLSERIQKQIRSYRIPTNLRVEIEKNYHQLQNNGVDFEVGYAVRSSATIEDRNDISFAGQAESCLCVRGVSHILKAMKRVWQSTFSPSAMIYLKTKGISLNQVRMAVVVQEMIPARISGVIFTANVVNNNAEEMLVNATWGWGEALVSGKVNPDTFVLKKNPLSVIQKHLGQKQLTCVSSRIDDNMHTVLEETPQSKRGVFTLEDHELFELAELCLNIESDMGKPQDIEWCITSDGKPVILQTRPITTLNVLL